MNIISKVSSLRHPIKGRSTNCSSKPSMSCHCLPTQEEEMMNFSHTEVSCVSHLFLKTSPFLSSLRLINKQIYPWQCKSRLLLTSARLNRKPIECRQRHPRLIVNNLVSTTSLCRTFQICMMMAVTLPLPTLYRLRTLWQSHKGHPLLPQVLAESPNATAYKLTTF